MENIVYATNDQLWAIERAARDSGFQKTDDCYWAQIFRNPETGKEFGTVREDSCDVDPLTAVSEILQTEEDLKVTVQAIRERVEEKKPRSAWERGVNIYANEILDTLDEAIEGGYLFQDDLEAPKILEKAMLNGASSWGAYSWGGCSLCYDSDIAERLCAPSELKRKRGGDLRPNRSEEWLDVQARALFQASRKILWAARVIRHEGLMEKEEDV